MASEWPPAMIVHGLPSLRLALAAGQRVTLLSAPAAGIFAGVGWWRALIEAAQAQAPQLVAADILDCGDAPGRALEALRGGQRVIVLRAPAPVWHDVAARVAGLGGTLLDEPPPALDLGRPDAAWLLAGRGKPAPAA